MLTFLTTSHFCPETLSYAHGSPLRHPSQEQAAPLHQAMPAEMCTAASPTNHHCEKA